MGDMSLLARARAADLYRRPKRGLGQRAQLVVLRAVVYPRLEWMLRGRDPVVIVHQMGKTGSKAIQASLEATELAGSVLHTHFLNRRDRARHRRVMATTRWSPPRSWVTSEFIHARLLGTGRASQLRFVVPVREPIARNLSAFFYSLPTHVLQRIENMDPVARREYLTDRFLGEFDSGRTLNWMEREMGQQLGFDLDGPFDHDARAQVLTNTAGARAIILRQEDIADVVPARLTEFLGVEVRSVPHTNSAADRREAAVYDDFRRHVSLPEAYVTTMLNSRFARAYYSPAERESLATHWLRR